MIPCQQCLLTTPVPSNEYLKGTIVRFYTQSMIYCDTLFWCAYVSPACRWDRQQPAFLPAINKRGLCSINSFESVSEVESHHKFLSRNRRNCMMAQAPTHGCASYGSAEWLLTACMSHSPCRKVLKLVSIPGQVSCLYNRCI